MSPSHGPLGVYLGQCHSKSAEDKVHMKVNAASGNQFKYIIPKTALH